MEFFATIGVEVKRSSFITLCVVLKLPLSGVDLGHYIVFTEVILLLFGSCSN